MSRPDSHLTSLESRKRLLLAESELNRAQLLGDIVRWRIGHSPGLLRELRADWTWLSRFEPCHLAIDEVAQPDRVFAPAQCARGMHHRVVPRRHNSAMFRFRRIPAWRDVVTRCLKDSEHLARGFAPNGIRACNVSLQTPQGGRVSFMKERHVLGPRNASDHVDHRR